MSNARSLSPNLFERALAWTVEQCGEAEMLAARRAFEAATGAIVDGAWDYEPRISHFWEQHLCTGPKAPVARFADTHPDLTPSEREELAGWLRSHRSLFAFEGLEGETGVVRDCVLGGRYRFVPGERDQKLTPADRFDARLVAVGDALLLSPGRVYHPAEARAALDALLERVERESLSHLDLLDALLLMRARFLEFASVRAEHVYQERALSPVRLPLRGEAK